MDSRRESGGGGRSPGPKGEKPILDQLRDVMSGKADATTRARIAAELQNEGSDLYLLLESTRENARRLFGCEVSNERPKLQ